MVQKKVVVQKVVWLLLVWYSNRVGGVADGVKTDGGRMAGGVGDGVCLVK